MIFRPKPEPATLLEELQFVHVLAVKLSVVSEVPYLASSDSFRILAQLVIRHNLPIPDYYCIQAA